MFKKFLQSVVFGFGFGFAFLGVLSLGPGVVLAQQTGSPANFNWSTSVTGAGPHVVEVRSGNFLRDIWLTCHCFEFISHDDTVTWYVQPNEEKSLNPATGAPVPVAVGSYENQIVVPPGVSVEKEDITFSRFEIQGDGAGTRLEIQATCYASFW